MWHDSLGVTNLPLSIRHYLLDFAHFSLPICRSPSSCASANLQLLFYRCHSLMPIYPNPCVIAIPSSIYACPLTVYLFAIAQKPALICLYPFASVHLPAAMCPCPFHSAHWSLQAASTDLIVPSCHHQVTIVHFFLCTCHFPSPITNFLVSFASVHVPVSICQCPFVSAHSLLFICCYPCARVHLPMHICQCPFARAHSPLIDLPFAHLPLPIRHEPFVSASVSWSFGR